MWENSVTEDTARTELSMSFQHTRNDENGCGMEGSERRSEPTRGMTKVGTELGLEGRVEP